MTGAEYAPHREINITNIQLLRENLTVVDLQKKDDVVKFVVNTDKKTEPDIIQSGLTLQEAQGINIEDDIDDINVPESDRYLSDKEIRSLTDILHTVKKADLDAIVEIYNLAQDIYKEIDKTSTDRTLLEGLNTGTSRLGKQTITSDKFKKVTKHDHVSYWMKNDINPQMSDIPNAPGVQVPAARVVKMDSKPTVKTVIAGSPPSYFNGALSPKDFGKLPYFYPISNFQRMSSYNHEQQKTIKTTAITPTLSTKTTHKTVAYKPLYSGGKYQKELRPSLYLPYPFTNVQHYNWSFPQHMYYTDLFEKVNTRKTDDSRHMFKKHGTKHNNAVLMNPDLENFQDLEIKASMANENIVKTNTNRKEGTLERRKPDWQTDSLPQQLLDEVRAHIQEKQRLFIHPYPLRKKIKLERVAKVLNMDKLTRTKRSEEAKSVPKEESRQPELFEVYIEKLT